MFCKKCGKRIEDYRGPCPHCGYDNGILQYNSGGGSAAPNPYQTTASVSPSIADVSQSTSQKAEGKRPPRTSKTAILVNSCLVAAVLIVSLAIAFMEWRVGRETEALSQGVGELQSAVSMMLGDSGGAFLTQQDKEEILDAIHALPQSDSTEVGDSESNGVSNGISDGWQNAGSTSLRPGIEFRSQEENTITPGGECVLYVVANTPEVDWDWRYFDRDSDSWVPIRDNMQQYEVTHCGNYSQLKIKGDSDFGEEQYKCSISSDSSYAHFIVKSTLEGDSGLEPEGTSSPDPGTGLPGWSTPCPSNSPAPSVQQGQKK